MVTITISGAEKSGALARIASFLVRKGYPLKGQQVAESASGAKLVKISIEVSHLDKAKLAAEIRSLSPDFRVVSVEGAQSATPSIKDMADRFPDIASLVRAYGESFGPESRDRELVEAGKKIGALHAGIPGCRRPDAEQSRSKSCVQGEGRFALHLQVQL